MIFWNFTYLFPVQVIAGSFRHFKFKIGTKYNSDTCTDGSLKINQG